MLHFAFAIYSIAFSTLAGALSIAVIVMGYFSWTSMISYIIAGPSSLPLSPTLS